VRDLPYRDISPHDLRVVAMSDRVEENFALVHATLRKEEVSAAGQMIKSV